MRLGAEMEIKYIIHLLVVDHTSLTDAQRPAIFENIKDIS